MTEKLKISEKLFIGIALISVAALICFTVLSNDKTDAASITSIEYFDYGDSEVAETEKININTADLKALMTLPGIGSAKAQKIIEYRENVGLFETIDDIVKVNGIGNAMFVDMMDYITVG